MSILKHAGERRFFDEKKIPLDVWQVLRTAAVLSIPEFRVFEIAYKQWFGEDTDEATIESHFVPYMFKDAVPMWVRHFCKRVLKLDKDGTLNPTEFGITSPVATREQQSRGVEFMILAVASIVTLVLLAELAAQAMKLNCMFPPCY